MRGGPSSHMLSLVAAVIATTVALAPARADRVADADALFRAAKSLGEEGRWAEACPKFAASHELDPQLGVLMNLAHCYEETERLASAWARWNAAVEWAQREGDDRLEYAEERRAAVEPKLRRLSIVVEGATAGLSVYRGDQAVPPASYGLPLPVDLAVVVVQIRRGQVILQTRRVPTEPGEKVELRLDLAAVAAAHPVESPPRLPPPELKPIEVPPEPYDPTQRILGWAIGGVGLAGILAAGGLEVAALVKRGRANADDGCVNRFCAPDGLSAANDARTFAEAGQWTGIAGIGLLAVGLTVLLTAPEEPETIGWTTAPWGGRQGGGWQVGARF